MFYFLLFTFYLMCGDKKTCAEDKGDGSIVGGLILCHSILRMWAAGTY
jgi:hypothetical protein